MCLCICGHVSTESAISPRKLPFFRSSTVEENILAVLEAQPIPWHERRERMEKLIDQMGLEHHPSKSRARPLGRRTSPRRNRRSLCINPTFILLDEPFSGIDPLAVFDLQKIIGGLKASGIGVLITDHNVRETLSVTDRAYIINEGRISGMERPNNWVSTPKFAEFIWEKVSRWYEVGY